MAKRRKKHSKARRRPKAEPASKTELSREEQNELTDLEISLRLSELRLQAESEGCGDDYIEFIFGSENDGNTDS